MKDPKSVQRVFLIAFVANFTIATLELVYGLWSNTLSMVANGFHSYVDCLSSILGFVAIYIAAQPSDEKHHYGHHKFETVSALGISLFIILTSWEIGKHAIERMIDPVVPEYHLLGFAVIAISIGTNIILSRFEKNKSVELHSHALEADAMHTLTDVWVSVVVLVSLICISFDLVWVDTVFSLIIALFFFYTAIKIIRKNVFVLTDAAFIDVAAIKTIVQSEPDVIDCHHIRTRGSEGNAFVDMHIQLPPEMTTLTAHRLVHRIEDKVKNNISGIREVMIHTEPFPDDDDTFVTDHIV